MSTHMTSLSLFGVYGAPDPDLAELPAGVVQFSPRVPDSPALEDAPADSLAGMVMAAPAGTLERRYALALALRALAPGATFTVMAPKEKGGGRIAQELEAFGCAVKAASRRHQRICTTHRPEIFGTEALAGIDAAVAAGAPRFVEALGLWSQPGIFSWDRIDPGTALLISVLPPFTGHGADLGCGIGMIARAVLMSPRVTQMELIDIDRRAITAARRNADDARARFHWRDIRKPMGLTNLDFVVINPPFHDGGREDKALGQTFVRQAHEVLREGGTAWLVANRHLPYEAALKACFTQVASRLERDGFKVYEAKK